MNFLRYLFLIREIKSRKGQLHFQRWRLIQTPWFAIYIHRIFMHDEDKHFHDHPWSFVNCILSGGYCEVTLCPDRCLKSVAYPYCKRIAYHKSTDYHKISHLYEMPTTTLVFVGPRNREWGYNVGGEWIHNEEYRKRKRAGEWK